MSDIKTSAQGAARLVAFHSRHTDPSLIKPDSEGVAYAVQALALVGIPAVFISNTYSLTGGKPFVRSHAVTLDANTMKLTVALKGKNMSLGAGGIGAVRTRSITPIGLEAIVPVLNGPIVRAMDISKFGQALRFPDVVPKTVLIPAGRTITTSDLNALSGDLVVLKPDHGRGGHHVKVGVAKSEANAALLELRAGLGPDKVDTQDFVLQEQAKGEPITGLRAHNPAQQPLVDTQDFAVNYELRLLCFASYDRKGEFKLRPYGLYRVDAGLERGVFVALRQSSVPKVAIDLATRIVKAILKEANVPAAQVAVDMFKRKGYKNLWLREYNARDPVIVKPASRSAEVQRARAALLADQLQSVI